ncbi:MAG TPA: twin-arginine translocase subunit TatC [Mycobacteriales bacterium]|nr:twin-arginine translocase subunit TatC [Mycobacteriales bacterium]
MSADTGTRRPRLPGVRLPGAKRRARTVDDARMSLVEHLIELRSRLTKASLAIVVATTVIALVAYDQVFHIIRRPYCEVPQKYRPVLSGATTAVHDSCTFVASGPTDQFGFRLKVALFGGLIVSAPIWVYQLWAFIAPGLHRREKKWTYIFVTISTGLFVTGGVLAYFLLGKALELLLGVGGSHIVTLLDVNKYVSFALSLVVVFGLGFEFPLAMSILNITGIISTARLKSWRRVVYFILTAFAAVAVPTPDPFTMLALAIPLCLLYEVTILVGRVHDRRAAARDSRSLYADLADDETSPLDTSIDPVDGPSPVAPPSPVNREDDIP